MAGIVRVVADSDEPLIEYQRPSAGPAAAVEVAADDVLIDRPDLGPGVTTFVRKGDKIRGKLTGYPRRPA